MDNKGMVFVFGSNLAGIHGAGAARYAALHHGALRGLGEGFAGNSYALPTKNALIESLSAEDVKESVRVFLEVASSHPGLKFQVTRIGCGLAGFSDTEIAPLFAGAPGNCFFDEAWREYLPAAKFWGKF